MEMLKLTSWGDISSDVLLYQIYSLKTKMDNNQFFMYPKQNKG